jgi:iron complex outermembrane recepter protein
VFKIESSLRSALFMGAATAAALSVTPAFAQQAGVETVIVTGSRIPQVGAIAPSPVSLVSKAEMTLEGTTDVGTLLNNLPSVFAGQTAQAGNGSSGTVTVDLRGLGASRTLVLIDGKRLLPGDAEVPVPDLNQIPAALVDHVEVLTGGASAVYGSDALAGVVNFIMRKDFEGVEVDAKAGFYQHNNTNNYMRGLIADAGYKEAPDSVFDGATYDTTVIVGTNTANGKGNVTAYFGYQRQNQVLQKSRDFSACTTANYYTSDPAVYDYMFCAGSSNYSRFKSLNGTVGGTHFIEPGGAIVPFVGGSSQTYNYGADNTLIRPQTRWEGGAFAHYEVDPMLDVYANFMFTDTHNSWQAAPSGIFTSSGAQFNLGNAWNYNVNCDNPLLTAQFISDFCPGGVSSTADAHMIIGRRSVEGGPRITDFRHTSYRMVVGAKGELGDGWTYDVSAQEGLTLYQQLYLHDWSMTNTQNALLVNPNGTCQNGDPACVPLDIFHGIGGVTQPMLHYIESHGQRTGYTEEQILSGSVTGDLGQYGVKSPWAANGVGVSGGAEYRKEILSETTSVADYSGDLSGAGGKALGQPKSAVWDWEVFVETRIPVVSDKPFIEDLSLNGGYRYSSFSTSGASAVRSFKYGAEFQPIDDFRLRASFQRAVRAPNVLELFSPANVVLGNFTDPCAGATPAASLAGCEASGMTAAQYGTVDQCVSNQCNYQSGGNVALKPEKSDTRSFGIVLTPTFVPGLTVIADYFNINVKDYIGIVQPTVALYGCTSLTNTALCPLIHRDSNGTVASPFGYVIGTNVNTGYLKTSGVDIQVNYLTDLNDWGLGDNGSLAFDVYGTWVNNYLVQPYTGASSTVGSKTYTNYDCAGLFGLTCGTPTPSWRHKARVTWSTPWDLDFSLQWRHMSGVNFDGNDPNPFINIGTYVTKDGGGKIATFDWLDFAMTWNATKTIQLSAGVNNVLDRNPPLLSSGDIATGALPGLNGNTFDGIYDSLGRYMFVGITLKS